MHRKAFRTIACSPVQNLHDKTSSELRRIAFKTIALAKNWTAPVAHLKSSKIIHLATPKGWVEYLLPGTEILVLCHLVRQGLACIVTCWDLRTSRAIGSVEVDGYRDSEPGMKSNLFSDSRGSYLWAYYTGRNTHDDGPT